MNVLCAHAYVCSSLHLKLSTSASVSSSPKSELSSLLACRVHVKEMEGQWRSGEQLVMDRDGAGVRQQWGESRADMRGWRDSWTGGSRASNLPSTKCRPLA